MMRIRSKILIAGLVATLAVTAMSGIAIAANAASEPAASNEGGFAGEPAAVPESAWTQSRQIDLHEAKVSSRMSREEAISRAKSMLRVSDEPSSVDAHYAVATRPVDQARGKGAFAVERAVWIVTLRNVEVQLHGKPNISGTNAPGPLVRRGDSVFVMDDESGKVIEVVSQGSNP